MMRHTTQFKWIISMGIILYYAFAPLWEKAMVAVYANGEQTVATPYERKKWRMAFYNTENFFDTFEDSIKKDDDFTPWGLKHWGRSKYEAKCLSLFKLISALNAAQSLACIGLAEVENDRVLNDLCRGTPLRYQGFKFIHFESPDPRGIDVALLYNPQMMEILSTKPIEIIYPPDTVSRTRHILYVHAVLHREKADSIHLFVVHFPSKYGGAMETEMKRFWAGKKLRASMDSVQKNYPGQKILAMGDFNGEADEEPLKFGIGYVSVDSFFQRGDYINLMTRFAKGEGSQKFRENWSLIDQILINTACLEADAKPPLAFIYRASFLLEEDRSYFGEKPFRTFSGPRYLGGYSDHLPVYVDL